MKQRALLIGLAFASLVAQGDEPIKEVVIGDARIGPAFYEVAPESVSRGGERTKDGFVCAGPAEWKYYPSGIYDESGQCIAVWYVSKKERHSVGVPD